jgi:hypothetical protein
MGNRALVYVYVSALDLVGHLRGPDTESWREQLSIVDRVAERIAAGIGSDTTMYITADHGMVHVPDEAKVDFDGTPALQDGVLALAGEPRMRHVHTRPGAARDVRSAWQQQLGDDWVVTTAEEAITAGLFGPDVSPTARARIGDVIAIAMGNGGVVERRKLPRLSAMPGQHGSLTDADLLVPLLSTSAG